MRNGIIVCRLSLPNISFSFHVLRKFRDSAPLRTILMVNFFTTKVFNVFSLKNNMNVTYLKEESQL